MATLPLGNREDEAVDQEPEDEAPPVYVGLNIYQRLALVAKGTTSLKKDGVHEIRKDGKKVGSFDYISHDAVILHMRDRILDSGIVVVPSVKSCTKDGNRTEMCVSVDFVCLDNPEDRVAVESWGYGCDSTDKGPGKAYSYAVKYAYMKMFLLNSGDDTQSEEHDPDAKRQSQEDAESEFTVEDISRMANALNLALDGAVSAEDIRKLKKENRRLLEVAPEITRDFFNTKIENRLLEIEREALQ